MSFSDEDMENERSDEESYNDLYGVRNGSVFVIDATPPMFENDPHEGIPYFLQCIRQYKEILKQKLLWNRQDWMGLVLFGTEKGDSDLGMEHVLTLQKFHPVSVKDIKQIMEIDEGGKWRYYQSIASTIAYPLYDALWQAARVFTSVCVTMPLRKVLLFTCQDNPPMTDNNEKHRIRVKIQDYNDANLQLFVVGLGENWNHDLFYKDLEMMSKKIDPDDYERMFLKDILQQIKLPSRNMAKLPLRFGDNVNINVSLYNFCVKTTYLRKKNISKATAIPLNTHSYLQIASDGIESEDEENAVQPSHVLEMDVQKYQTYGGKNIRFTLPEELSLCRMQQPGIDLICMKPVSYHPLYHFGPPYLVTPTKSSNKDQKLLFAALLHKCDAKDLMIICAVTIQRRSSPLIYAMIPQIQKGFYLYNIPFKENVREISQHLSEYIYDDNNNLAPTDANGIEVLEKMINELSIEYNSNLFSNPKLQAQLQTVETLALQLENSDPIIDTTLPKTEEMRERVKDLLVEYDKIFNENTDHPTAGSSSKRNRSAGVTVESTMLEDSEKVQKLVETGQIQKFTVLQLKSALRKLYLKTSGRKDELIHRITQYYRRRPPYY
nr:X-ray repair cross-complementing protein 5-like [Osmia lignaria]